MARRIVFLLLGMCFFAGIISGCATCPISNESATPASNDRILNHEYLKPRPECGQVTVKRDQGFTGSACSSRVFVDAKPVADINESEKVVLYLSEGEHILSAWPNGICGGGMAEVKTNVKKGGRTSFRIGYGSNGDYFIVPTAF